MKSDRPICAWIGAAERAIRHGSDTKNRSLNTLNYNLFGLMNYYEWFFFSQFVVWLISVEARALWANTQIYYYHQQQQMRTGFAALYGPADCLASLHLPRESKVEANRVRSTLSFSSAREVCKLVAKRHTMPPQREFIILSLLMWAFRIFIRINIWLKSLYAYTKLTLNFSSHSFLWRTHLSHAAT